MSLKKKVVFALIPAVVLFGSAEIACLVWERFDPPLTSLVQAPESLPDREPNEFRVLFYGGSTVVGEPEVSVGFVRQLKSYGEKVAPGRSVRFFNFAAAGQPSAFAVRTMYQTAPGGDADAIVVLTAHNEFLMIDDMSDDALANLYAIQESLHRSALVRRARRVHYRYVVARRSEMLAGDNLSRLDRKSNRFAERVARFEENMDSMARIAERAGVPLFLCTGPRNLADWAPSNDKYSRYAPVEGYLGAVARARALVGEGKPGEARSFCVAALKRYPDDASLTYAMGRASLALGEIERARELLGRARDLDTIPFRVLSRFNETIRNLHDPPGVTVVDLARLFDAGSPHGITGFNLIADNCHPTPQGGFLIATALLDAFAAAGLLELNQPAENAVDLAVFLRAAGFEQRKDDYFLTNARTAMKPPYHNFELAGRYLRKAVEADPENWQALANLATVHFRKGELEEGRRALALAAEKKGSRIDSNDREATPYLKEAMENAGAGAER